MTILRQNLSGMSLLVGEYKTTRAALCEVIERSKGKARLADGSGISPGSTITSQFVLGARVPTREYFWVDAATQEAVDTGFIAYGEENFSLQDI